MDAAAIIHAHVVNARCVENLESVIDNGVGTDVVIAVTEFDTQTHSLEVRSREIMPSPHLVSGLTGQTLSTVSNTHLNPVERGFEMLL
jgi:hypothetical protein